MKKYFKISATIVVFISLILGGMISCTKEKQDLSVIENEKPINENVDYSDINRFFDTDHIEYLENQCGIDIEDLASSTEFITFHNSLHDINACFISQFTWALENDQNIADGYIQTITEAKNYFDSGDTANGMSTMESLYVNSGCALGSPQVYYQETGYYIPFVTMSEEVSSFKSAKDALFEEYSSLYSLDELDMKDILALAGIYHDLNQQKTNTPAQTCYNNYVAEYNMNTVDYGFCMTLATGAAVVGTPVLGCIAACGCTYHYSAAMNIARSNYQNCMSK